MATEANQELVTIFETEQESEAMVVHSLLESAGIESLVTSLYAQQEVLPGVGGVVVRVSPEEAEEARNVIAEYRSHPLADDSRAPDEGPNA